jgi:hypothetical protein
LHYLSCPSCRTEVYFDNVACLNCGCEIAFDDSRLSMVEIGPLKGPGHFWARMRRSLPANRCRNFEAAECNWIEPADEGEEFCRACALNQTIPNLATDKNRDAWVGFERAKKRLVYSLLRLGLPFDDTSGARLPLRMSLLEDAMTGHSRGLITIAVDETDSAEREKQRKDMNEPYRTLLGHLRHESGHYFWDELDRDGPWLEQFRGVFGDERADYQAAMTRHYDIGPPPSWPDRFISAYASMHPWEDWAETWAHYFHIIDVTDTASAIASTKARTRSSPALKNAYQDASFDTLLQTWFQLTVALNELSRSMGHEDFYAFVIPEPATEKLRFVHDVIRSTAGGNSSHL